MKRTGKILTAILSLVLATTLFACGGSDGNITPDNWDKIDEEQEITLKFTHIWPEHDATFDTICENFTKQYKNVKIQKSVKNYGNIDTALNTSWGSSQFPDVSFYWTHGMYKLVNGETQMAADLSEIYYEAHKDEFIGDGDCFVSGKINGKYYNVPFRATGFVIYYNKTLFDSLGLTEPKNLEEFEKLLADLKELAPELTPLACWGAAGTYSYIGAALQVYYDILSGRASDPNYRTDRLENSDADIDNAAYIMEKVRRWTKLGYFGSNPLAGSTESVESAFLNETCAMAMLNNNSLGVIQEDMDAEVGCFSIPGFSLMDNPQAGYISGGYDGFFISNASRNKGWALRFLEYLNSAEVQQLFADNEGSVMSRKNVKYTGLQQNVAACMASVGRYGAFADYKLSESAGASSMKINQYTVQKNGSFEDCRKLIEAAYKAKKASVEDIMVNPGGLKMIKPTYTVNTDKVTQYMTWIGKGE